MPFHARVLPGCLLRPWDSSSLARDRQQLSLLPAIRAAVGPPDLDKSDNIFNRLNRHRAM